MNNQIQTAIEFNELATNTMRANMTPAQKIRAKAELISKDLIRAYEVGATMKDLDGVVSMWAGIIEKALLEAAQPLEPKVSVQTAIALRDRATQVALNFVGHSISSSDGSYEILIQVIHDALVVQSHVSAKAERDECVKICQKADKSTHPADLADLIRSSANPTFKGAEIIFDED